MDSIEIKLLIQSHSGVAEYELREEYSEFPEVKETDSVSFTVRCNHSRGEPKVFIQDHVVVLNRQFRTGEFTEFSVDFDRYFLNHFGITSLAIAFSTTDEFFRITPINVFATKINKEQAEKILEYLSVKMEDVTKICFSKTQVGSNSRASDNTDTLTKIGFSRKILEGIYASRHRFSNQPCKRSVEALKVTPYEDGSYITDKDIAWLFQHLDQLYPVPSDVSKVSIQNRHYSIDRIQRTVVEIKTDLFENQVIYGFLFSLKAFLLSIPHYQKKKSPSASFEGFYAFDSVVISVEAPLLERRFREAQTLVRQCNELIDFFNKNLPCTHKGALRPILTPQAKRFPHYERTFRLIDSWYQLGQPKWTGSNYLFGMKSLDKLYEFFCLYKMADALVDVGYSLSGAETRVADRARGINGVRIDSSEDHLSNYYMFDGGGKKVELYYEPTIWAYNECSVAGELIDVFHGKNSTNPYWTPDFLLRVTNLNLEENFFIFDAKYSNDKTTKDRHLPEIINKYYLKIRRMSLDGTIEAPGAIKLVYALIPKTYTEELGFHGGPFNIYDKLAAPPYFGFVKLSPDEERPFSRMLKQALM